MNWISVNDRLPEESGRYLVVLDMFNEVREIDVGNYCGDGWYIEDRKGWKFPIIPSYWMPLPDPPKEVSTEDGTDYDILINNGRDVETFHYE